MSRLAFHRPARFLPPPLSDEKVVLPTPPEARSGTGASTWVSMVLPLISSMAMVGYMISFGRPLLVVIGIVFVLVSIGTTVTMQVQTRSANRKAGKRQRARYSNHLAAVRSQARAVATVQRMHVALVHPEPERLWGIVTGYHRVWERRQSDPDFLRIRLGVGQAHLSTPMQIGTRLDPMAEYDWDSLQAAQKLVDRMGRVEGQPSVVDVGASGVISVLGPRPAADGVVRALLCQVAVLHAPEDVAIAVEASVGDWGSAKWLPHTIEPDAPSEAGVVPLVAAGPEDLADYLERELERRQEQAAARRGQIGFDRGSAPVQRRLIVLFTGFDPVSEWGRSALLRALLEAAGPQLGITLIFLAEREVDEPSRVDLRIQLTDTNELEVTGTPALVAATAQSVVPDVVSPATAELIARRLAPLRLSDERDQVLSRIVSLTEMLLGGDPATADITGRWANATGERLLRVPIGSDGDGEPVVLDIKESAQGGSGPHGLIVGATGSGKSELLRTLVTGLAVTHSPETISFVLVDFKGGAAFAPLTDLPHVAGLITNLSDDVAMIDRVQAALQGEQQRRQQLLRQAGNLDSIREYQQRQAAGRPGPDGRPLEPLPYLVIIVDEFGELLSGRPEFTDLFVQIGRVGRSLGMHLLLATQRLEEGRLRGLDSHLSYRICLRTFSAQESRTVIGTPDAYRLPPVPGSAYLKVDESVYQRFRVAHVSGPYLSAQQRAQERAVRSAIVPFGIRERPAAEATPAPDRAPAAAEHRPGPTELGVVVDRLKQVGRPAHQVWLPPLPAAIAMDNLIGAPGLLPGRGYGARIWAQPGTLKVPIGVIDLPLQQEQQPLVMDFGGPHGHLAVVGAPQTGRSTALRTIMLAGMLTLTPEEAQFYAIDFGGGTLHQYQSAPHVGSVAGRGDQQLVRRTLAEIRGLIVAREKLFRKLSVDSIADFRARRAAGRLPDGLRTADVFLLIDNWGAVRSELEDAEPLVADIAARGLGVGVHLVLSASRWLEIRPALRDSIGTRVELRLNDPAESEVNRRLAARIATAVPGRGIAQPGVHFQLLLPRLDGRETAEGIGEAQEDALAKISAGWTGAPAPAVRMLPARLTVAQLRELPVRTTGVPVGLAEADLAPVTVDLSGETRHFMVLGDSRSGKTSFLRTWIAGLVDRHSALDIRIVLVDYRRSLLDAVPADHLGAYAMDGRAAEAYVQQVCDKLRERLPPSTVTVAELQARSWWEGPEIYVVLDDYDLVGTGHGSPLAPLAEFVPHAREVGLHIVLARRVTGMSRASMADVLMTRIRELGCDGLVLDGDPREGPLLGDERAAPRPPGRGVLVRRSAPNALVQIALSQDADESAASALAPS
ncbi:type VII secretion protein EccCb [Dactylosporangium salmoneum]|uniref:Type VII secretion protein EccC n=1 Tax=Dactylosporangium salmoneum TaxID=53361 RepID=A0ABN3HB47_9ACTN